MSFIKSLLGYKTEIEIQLSEEDIKLAGRIETNKTEKYMNLDSGRKIMKKSALEKSFICHEHKFCCDEETNYLKFCQRFKVKPDKSKPNEKSKTEKPGKIKTEKPEKIKEKIKTEIQPKPHPVSKIRLEQSVEKRLKDYFIEVFSHQNNDDLIYLEASRMIICSLVLKLRGLSGSVEFILDVDKCKEIKGDKVYMSVKNSECDLLLKTVTKLNQHSFSNKEFYDELTSAKENLILLGVDLDDLSEEECINIERNKTVKWVTAEKKLISNRSCKICSNENIFTYYNVKVKLEKKVEKIEIMEEKIVKVNKEKAEKIKKTETEKSEKPKTRKAIPQVIRKQVWNQWCGEEFYGKCFCCDGVVSIYDWECSHIVAAAEGGSDTPDNLRVCDKDCNRSMSNQLMYRYMLKYSTAGCKNIPAKIRKQIQEELDNE